MNWKEDARRTIIGKKENLVSFEGYWVKAKKYSTQGKDEITEATRNIQKGIDKKVLMSAAKKYRSTGKDVVSEDELFDLLTAEEIATMMDSSTVPTSELFKAKLKNGVYSHNFCEGDIETRSTEKDIKGFANDILEFEEIALEIIKIVEDFNRPLVVKTSSISETSPSGSTTEPNSSMETISGKKNQPS